MGDDQRLLLGGGVRIRGGLRGCNGGIRAFRSLDRTRALPQGRRPRRAMPQTLPPPRPPAAARPRRPPARPGRPPSGSAPRAAKPPSWGVRRAQPLRASRPSSSQRAAARAPGGLRRRSRRAVPSGSNGLCCTSVHARACGLCQQFVGRHSPHLLQVLASYGLHHGHSGFLGLFERGNLAVCHDRRA